ncbi:hypothetical protein N7507_003213 [Penicillium longicatenatum]|nr:hypothetical protein N7507_003213 [Penicillium longicatenatum]
MHLYFVLTATLTMAVSTAFAGGATQQSLADVDCLNLCKDTKDSYSCPPDTEKSQLDNVSFDFKGLLRENND